MSIAITRHGEPPGAFEQHALAGLDPCVHCGFCLPACPTYEVTADEADSPRGRIVLMRALARGELAEDDPGLRTHLDQCLGCRGCESVCPSGVVFGPALEATRARLAAARPLPPALRAALWVLAVPSRQRALWAMSRALRATGLPAVLSRAAGAEAPTVARMLAMLAGSAPLDGSVRGEGGERRERGARSGAVHPHLTPPSPPSPPSTPSHREAMALFRGCVQNGLFGHVHQATRVALAANEVAPREVPGQVCCGALAAHAGADVMARDLARRNVLAFDAAAPDAQVVVNSAGCGAMLKAYGDWLADDPLAGRAARFAARVRDVSEVLAERGPRPGVRRIPLRVATDAPCHLLHAQRVSGAPARLLAAVPGLTVTPLAGAERCCGAAGLYALVEPGLSRAVLATKLDAIRRAAPDVVATGNPGCAMHMAAGAHLEGLDVPVVHPVELYAWSCA